MIFQLVSVRYQYLSRSIEWLAWHQQRSPVLSGNSARCPIGLGRHASGWRVCRRPIRYSGRLLTAPYPQFGTDRDGREAVLDRKAMDLAPRIRALEGDLAPDGPDLVRLCRAFWRVRLQRHMLRRRAGGSQPPPTLGGIRDRGAWPNHTMQACATKFFDAERSPRADAILQARWGSVAAAEIHDGRMLHVPPCDAFVTLSESATDVCGRA